MSHGNGIGLFLTHGGGDPLVPRHTPVGKGRTRRTRKPPEIRQDSMTATLRASVRHVGATADLLAERHLQVGHTCSCSGSRISTPECCKPTYEAHPIFLGPPLRPRAQGTDSLEVGFARPWGAPPLAITPMCHRKALPILI
jgi:hypothetical protein